MRTRGDEGEPISSPFPRLSALGAHFRRGQVSLVAAAPGCGKSALATHIALYSHAPTLYFSADCDRMTLGARIAASTTNSAINDIEAAIIEGDISLFEQVEKSTNHIWFNWEPSPSLEYIHKEVEAYGYYYGDWPHFIVIDNLKNISGDLNDADHRRYDQTIDFVHQIARQTAAHVMVLHHVVGMYEDGTQPIPLSGLLGKVGKTPRLVLSLYKSEPSLMGVCIIKNSSGKMDANGEYGMDLAWSPERSWLSDGSF